MLPRIKTADRISRERRVSPSTSVPLISPNKSPIKTPSKSRGFSENNSKERGNSRSDEIQLPPLHRSAERPSASVSPKIQTWDSPAIREKSRNFESRIDSFADRPGTVTGVIRGINIYSSETVSSADGSENSSQSISLYGSAVISLFQFLQSY
jgi:hypothetical protein